jgi:hypothetical protein
LLAAGAHRTVAPPKKLAAVGESARPLNQYGVIRMSRRQTTIAFPDRFDAADRFEWARFRRDPQLLDRAEFLCDGDRRLIQLSLGMNLSRRQMGIAMGVTAGTITRKLRRLLTRLRDPLVIAITDSQCTLPPLHRRIGIEYFLHRASIPQLAVKHDIPRVELRAMLEYVRGWHRGVSPRDSKTPSTQDAT